MSRPCLSPFLSGLRHHANGLHGEPTTEIREIHEVVRLAQQTGVDAMRPGVSC